MNWNNVKESRFNGLVEQIDFYAWKAESAKLSKEQINHVKELKQQISVFGERAPKWEQLCDEIFAK